MTNESGDVVILSHHQREQAVELVDRAVHWLDAHGRRPRLPVDDAVAIGREALGSSEPLDTASLVVCIGGDGTVLRAVRALDGAPVRILGVNVGVLGYLTEVEPERLEEALDAALANRCRVEERMMLSVSTSRTDGSLEGPWRALNEVSLEKREAGHTVRLRVSIDGEAFTSYQADGLVVATPTGSTAYSLSARGPVVSPGHRAVLVTPVAPHQLFDRSLVLRPDEPVEVEVLEHRMVDLTVDGQRVATLHQGDRVMTTVADQPAWFVRLGPDRFHQILKAKFRLTDR